MRALVISDIHANEEALRAVVASESVDHVLCLGDLVDYGPRPVEVVRWVRPPGNSPSPTSTRT